MNNLLLEKLKQELLKNGRPTGSKAELVQRMYEFEEQQNDRKESEKKQSHLPQCLTLASLLVNEVKNIVSLFNGISVTVSGMHSPSEPLEAICPLNRRKMQLINDINDER